MNSLTDFSFLKDSYPLWENETAKVFGNKTAKSFLKYKNTTRIGYEANLERNIFQKIVSWIFLLVKILKYWELWFASGSLALFYYLK